MALAAQAQLSAMQQADGSMNDLRPHVLAIKGALAEEQHDDPKAT